MVGKITHFKAEDFNQKGTFNQFHSECQLDNLEFKKGDAFKHEEIKQVLDSCKKYNNFGINTLIIQSESNLTIWIEQRFKDRADSEETTASTATQAPLPTKTVAKRYRGQVYEETVIDWAAVAMQKQGIQTENKQRRKYRGNYID